MVEHIEGRQKSNKVQNIDVASQSVREVGRKTKRGIKRSFTATLDSDPVLDAVIQRLAKVNCERIANSYHYAQVASLKIPGGELKSRSYSIQTGEETIDCVLSLYSQEEFYAKRVKASREALDADIAAERRDKNSQIHWESAKARFRSEINRLKSK